MSECRFCFLEWDDEEQAAECEAGDLWVLTLGLQGPLDRRTLAFAGYDARGGAMIRTTPALTRYL